MVTNNKFKKKINQTTAQALDGFISMVLRTEAVKKDLTDDDKMLYAVLAEVLLKLQTMLLSYKKEYSLKLTPPQAFAMRILYSSFVDNCKTNMQSYLGNELLKLSNEIDQQFN